MRAMMLSSFPLIRDLVTIFGVIAGFSYYALTVQNNRKNQDQQLETRQAQLFMNIYDTYSSKQYQKDSERMFTIWSMKIMMTFSKIWARCCARVSSRDVACA